MKLKPSKCEFFKLHIEYLGQLISGMGLYPLVQKIQAILDIAPPTNVTQVWHILGLASYYRKFIPLLSFINFANNCIDQKEHTIFMDCGMSDSTRYH